MSYILQNARTVSYSSSVSLAYPAEVTWRACTDVTLPTAIKANRNFQRRVHSHTSHLIH